jgi:hypothetical protein
MHRCRPPPATSKRGEGSRDPRPNAPSGGVLVLANDMPQARPLRLALLERCIQIDSREFGAECRIERRLVNECHADQAGPHQRGRQAS